MAAPITAVLTECALSGKGKIKELGTLAQGKRRRADPRHGPGEKPGKQLCLNRPDGIMWPDQVVAKYASSAVVLP